MAELKTDDVYRHLIIVALGIPAPQGSKRHVGNGVMIESSQALKPWREAVKAAAVDAMNHAGITEPFTGPIDVRMTFTFPRPKGHYRTGRNAHLLKDSAPARPAGKPDLSKLIRSTEDALTDVQAWRDDAQVVTVRAEKCYVATDRHEPYDAMTRPGVLIRLEPWTSRHGPYATPAAVAHGHVLGDTVHTTHGRAPVQTLTPAGAMEGLF